MTQVELAKRFGVSQPQVSCILRGQARTNTQNLTPYRQGWLAGVRFAADTARKAAAKPSFADKPAPEVLIEMSEGLALGASMRETEWEADQ
jgi:transcriptional regulator with XRE-family HTH domain